MWNKLMLVMKFECLFPSIFTYRSEKTIKTGFKKKKQQKHTKHDFKKQMVPLFLKCSLAHSTAPDKKGWGIKRTSC